MAAHERLFEVQLGACMLLQGITAAAGGRTGAHIIALDGLGTLMKAMEANIASPEVQRCGCDLIRELIIQGQQLGTKHHAVEAGVFEAVVRAMGRYPEDALLQQRGCAVLRLILAACSVPYKERAITAGCIEATVIAMSSDHSDAELQQAACGILQAVTPASREGHTRAVSAGAIQAVVALVKAFPQDRWLQDEAKLALKLMTSVTLN